VVLGTGLSTLARGSMPAGANFKTFIYPGVLAMSVMFTALFSAASIVWDREFGFLREMLVAPVSRAAIVVGKCLGGATIATMQGIVMLALAGLAGVPYDRALLLTLVGEMLLLSFTLTAFGVMMSPLVAWAQDSASRAAHAGDTSAPERQDMTSIWVRAMNNWIWVILAQAQGCLGWVRFLSPARRRGCRSHVWEKAGAEAMRRALYRRCRSGTAAG
jgi:ABC-2 family transporter